MNWKCKILGHIWDESNSFKQKCKRKDCSTVRVVMENRFPKIGEPQFEWKVMKDFEFPNKNK